MKERSRRTDVDATRESDEVIVPEKLSNKGIPVPAETVEERTSTKRNAGKEAAHRSQRRSRASIGLECVRRKARK